MTSFEYETQRALIAKCICIATQKTNQACKLKCKGGNIGSCAYCLVMSESLIDQGVKYGNNKNN